MQDLRAVKVWQLPCKRSPTICTCGEFGMQKLEADLPNTYHLRAGLSSKAVYCVCHVAACSARHIIFHHSSSICMPEMPCFYIKEDLHKAFVHDLQVQLNWGCSFGKLPFQESRQDTKWDHLFACLELIIVFVQVAECCKCIDAIKVAEVSERAICSSSNGRQHPWVLSLAYHTFYVHQVKKADFSSWMRSNLDMSNNQHTKSVMELLILTPIFAKSVWAEVQL